MRVFCQWQCKLVWETRLGKNLTATADVLAKGMAVVAVLAAEAGSEGLLDGCDFDGGGRSSHDHHDQGHDNDHEHDHGHDHDHDHSHSNSPSSQRS